MRLRFVLPLTLLAATAAHAQRGGGPPPSGGAPGGGGAQGGGGMNQPPPPPRNNGDTSAPGGGRHGDFDHPRNGPQLGPPGRWWDDKHIAQKLNLTPEQQHKMDSIFEANKGSLVAAFENLKKEEQKASTLSQQDLQDENKVMACIDHVAQARAELEKQNAHILLQIRHELDGQQLATLDKNFAPPTR